MSDGRHDDEKYEDLIDFARVKAALDDHREAVLEAMDAVGEGPFTAEQMRLVEWRRHADILLFCLQADLTGDGPFFRPFFKDAFEVWGAVARSMEGEGGA